MTNLNKKLILFLLLLLAGILLVENGHLRSRRPATIENLKENMVKSFSSKDSAEAYADFLRDYTKIESENVQHWAGHYFGSLLYEKEGIAGADICDHSFDYACYHGFFARAASENGVDAVGKIDELCPSTLTRKNTECVHGVGHGIAEYLGPDKLKEQVVFCKSLDRSDMDIFSCLNGVFMEYNTPAALEEESVFFTVRNAGDDLHTPCNFLGAFEKDCYVQQPLWWWEVFGGDFLKLEEVCLQVSDFVARQACFKGIGFTSLARSGLDEEASLRICQNLENPDMQLFCRAGANGFLTLLPDVFPQTEKLCSFGSINKELCLSESFVVY